MPSRRAPLDSGGAPRGVVRLAFDRNLGILAWGKLTAGIAMWAHNLIAAILAFQVTGSATIVGLTSAAQFVPQILLTPWTGRAADRGDPVRQIMLGRLCSALGSGGVALYLWLVGAASADAVAIALVASSVLLGVGFAVGGPAMQSIVPSLVRADELPAAMVLNNLPMTVARSVGPLLGAFAVSEATAQVGFALAAAGHLLFLVGLFAMTPVPHAAPDAGTDYSMRAALRHVLSDRPLLLVLLGVGAVGFGSEPAATLVAPLAHGLEASDAVAGWLASAFGAGAGLGIAVLAVAGRRLSVDVTGTLGLSLMAVGFGVATLAQGTGTALAAFAVSGLGMTTALTGLSTLVLMRAPEQLRGRVMALWFLGFLGMRPIAASIEGLLADVLSASAALAVTAGVLLAMALVLRPRRVRSSSAPRLP